MDRNLVAPFGELLSRFRARRRLRQNTLAASLGIHRNTIGRWERGEVLPDTKGIVLELAHLLKLSEQETRLLLEASLTSLSPYWVVPFPRNPLFTGRETILERMQVQLTTLQTGVLAPALALSGLGGIGKTQIALEFAYRHALKFNAVLWLTVETTDTVMSSLQQIAEHLQLTASQSADQRLIVAEVKRWLSMHQGWLLIGDNVEDMDLLHDVLPPDRQGALLLTTRHQTLGPLAEPIKVPSMNRAEGVTLLLQRARQPVLPIQTEHPLSPQQAQAVAAAEKLVELLEGLPLALDQAGAYIEETGCGVVSYLQRFQAQRKHVLAHRGTHAEHHPDSVATTLLLSVAQVERALPAAIDILKLCAFSHPESIPEELFCTETSEPGSLRDLLVTDSYHFDLALAALRSASLITRSPESRTFSVHRLVQAVLQDQMEQAEMHLWSEQAVRLVNRAFPEPDVATWGQCERLVAQALTCAVLVERMQNTREEAGTLLFKTGSYLLARGRYEEARPLLEQAVCIRKHHFGPDHPILIVWLEKQAELLWKQGKHHLTVPLLQQILALEEQHLGPRHSQTAETLNNLALMYWYQGKYEEAEPLYVRAWRIQEEQGGPDHLIVSEILTNLGNLYRTQGRYAEADQSLTRALQIQEKQLGPEHHQIGIILDNLAVLYHNQGNIEEAEPLLERALHLQEQQLGSEHPQAALTRTRLANLYREQGKYEQAQLFLKSSRHIFEEQLGLEHPYTATMFFAQALLSQALGNAEEAEAFCRRSLAIWEQQFGEHPQIALVLTALANLYREQNKGKEAELLYQRALHIREQRLGLKHPDTATTLHELAELYKMQGDFPRAISLYRRALTIREKTLGFSHAQTANTRQQLHILLCQTGQAEEGVGLNLALEKQ